MENNETTAEAALRETFEESGANAIIEAPFAMVSIAHINQVHLFYRAHLASPNYSAGDESLEVALFTASDIPWHEIAFRSVTFCLERYLEDRDSKRFGFHETSLPPMPETL